MHNHRSAKQTGRHGRSGHCGRWSCVRSRPSGVGCVRINVHQNGVVRREAGSGPLDQILTWGGVLLLLIGSALAYPYISSRLAAPPPPPTPASLQAAQPTLPQFTVTPPPTTAPSPTSMGTPPPSSTLVPPTTTPVPTPTPAPAPPSRIVIPSIGVDAPVVPVSWETVEVNDQEQTAWDVPDMYAAGWHDTSAPLGVPGNTVLNGHNTNNGEVFRDLYTLEAGDTIIVYSDDTPYTYTVSEVLFLPEGGQPLEVRLENARYIMPTDDERLSIVTCHPYGSLRYRLIVIAYPEKQASNIQPLASGYLERSRYASLYNR
jgi:sortase A